MRGYDVRGCKGIEKRGCEWMLAIAIQGFGARGGVVLLLINNKDFAILLLPMYSLVISQKIVKVLCSSSNDENLTAVNFYLFYFLLSGR